MPTSWLPVALMYHGTVARLISVRALAALDITLHGARLVLVEFAAGVGLPLTLGVLSVVRGRARWQIALGAYLILLGINYLPLLVYAILIVAKSDARTEAAAELSRRKQAASQYTAQSLFLLLPLVIPLLAVCQGFERHVRSSPER